MYPGMTSLSSFMHPGVYVPWFICTRVWPANPGLCTLVYMYPGMTNIASFMYPDTYVPSYDQHIQICVPGYVCTRYDQHCQLYVPGCIRMLPGYDQRNQQVYVPAGTSRVCNTLAGNISSVWCSHHSPNGYYIPDQCAIEPTEHTAVQGPHRLSFGVFWFACTSVQYVGVRSGPSIMPVCYVPRANTPALFGGHSGIIPHTATLGSSHLWTKRVHRHY